MTTLDHYTKPGVVPNADPANITKDFGQLACELHPGFSEHDDTQVCFKAVAEACAVLENPGQSAAPHAPQRTAAPHSDGLADLLAAFTRAYEFGSASGQATPEAGPSYEHTVYLTLLDAHQGTTLRVNVPSPQGNRSLDVTIPPGTTNGQIMRLREQDESDRLGGPAGDIYLHIVLKHDPVFSVHGHDLHMSVLLMPWQAILGADVEVPTLDGAVLLTVPPATRTDRKLRLRGRGLINGQGGRGDLYATMHIDIPAITSVEEQALYRSLADAASTQTPRTMLDQTESRSAES